MGRKDGKRAEGKDVRASFFRTQHSEARRPPCDDYVRWRDDPLPEFAAVRRMIETMWSTCSRYVDPRLPEKATEDFLAAFFELDVAFSLHTSGVPLGEKKKPDGPDVVCAGPIFVEAVVATSGKPGNADSVPPIPLEAAWGVPHEKIVLRLRNAIDSKLKAYDRYLKNGTLGPNDAYVIAINAARIPWTRFPLYPPDIVRAVYPIGEEYVTIDIATNNAVGGGYRPRDLILKASGSSVSTNVFQEAACDGISAIIYTTDDEWVRPNIQGANWVALRNPRATNKIPEGFFRFGSEFVPTEDGTRLHYVQHFEGKTRPKFVPSTHPDYKPDEDKSDGM